MKPEEPTDYSQPVAYDVNGQPLYAHPPAPQQTAMQPQQVVHVSRAVDPAAPEMSPEAVKRHDEATAKYPTLNLSKEEFIISEVTRHWFGLVAPIAVAVFLSLLVIFFLSAYPVLFPKGYPSFDSVLLTSCLVFILIGIGTYVVVWVYQSNKFFLTNESVIQEIQTSLFSHHEQTVSLANIEDASYAQNGIIQQMLNYGSIRLSTEGDETTYRFYYVSDPKTQIAILNNAVEAFKNGRPVNGD